MNDYDLWVDVDDKGHITDSYGGHKKYPSIPQEIVEDEVTGFAIYKERNFDYHFEVSAEIFKNIDLYKVENGELVLIQGFLF